MHLLLWVGAFFIGRIISFYLFPKGSWTTAFKNVAQRTENPRPNGVIRAGLCQGFNSLSHHSLNALTLWVGAFFIDRIISFYFTIKLSRKFSFYTRHTKRPI